MDGVSHHVGKPRLLEQKMGPENGVISWLPDIYIYIWPRQTHIHHIPVRFKESVIESNGRVQSRNLPTSHPNPPLLRSQMDKFNSEPPKQKSLGFC